MTERSYRAKLPHAFVWAAALLVLGMHVSHAQPACGSAEGIIDMDLGPALEHSIVALVKEVESTDPREDGELESVGTGFILNAHGDIAAARHVVAPRGELADDVYVIRKSEEELRVAEAYTLVEPPEGQRGSDWAILVRRHNGPLRVTSGVRGLKISHYRHLKDITEEWHVPETLTVWRAVYEESSSNGEALSITDFKATRNQTVDEQISGTAKYRIQLHTSGSFSGSVVTDACGIVFGIVSSSEASKRQSVVSHSGRLLEMAYNGVVDFDTTQGIFRGEVHRRQLRARKHLWSALEQQLNITEKENLEKEWKLLVTENTLTNALDGSQNLELRAVPAQKLPLNHHVRTHIEDNFSVWVCFIWGEIRESTHCTDQRLSKFVDPFLGREGQISGEASLEDFGGQSNIDARSVSRMISGVKAFYSLGESDEVTRDLQRQLLFENVDGYIVRVQFAFEPINLLRGINEETMIPDNSRPLDQDFLVTYEACIPAGQGSDETELTKRSSSHDEEYLDLLTAQQTGRGLPVLDQCLDEILQ